MWGGMRLSVRRMEITFQNYSDDKHYDNKLNNYKPSIEEFGPVIGREEGKRFQEICVVTHRTLRP